MVAKTLTYRDRLRLAYIDRLRIDLFRRKVESDFQHKCNLLASNKIADNKQTNNNQEILYSFDECCDEWDRIEKK